MWQVLGYLVLAIFFLVMFLIGFCILKTKASEVQTSLERIQDSFSVERTPSQMRSDQQRNNAFNNVVSAELRSEAQEMVSRVMNEANQANQTNQTNQPTYAAADDYFEPIQGHQAVSSKPTPESVPEPEEVIPPRESNNAIDDLDLP